MNPHIESSRATLDYFRRSCDCCGSSQKINIWRNKTVSRTRSMLIQWDMNHVVCSQCGFAYVSPSPTQESLTRYYQDSYEYWSGQELDYCMDRRIAFLQQCTDGTTINRFLEIGGNASDRFAAALEPYVSSYENLEPNRFCSSHRSDMQSIPSQSCDVIASYFLLEHIPNPFEHLVQCKRCLCPDGVLILEVPDVHVYPKDPSGLYWWEHVNHFSLFSLARLAQKAGLKLKTCSYSLCSRSFGFTASFIHDKFTSEYKPVFSDLEILNTRTCMNEALYKIQNHETQFMHYKNQIRETINNNQTVIVWGANKFCLDLLIDMPDSDSITVVDDNPGKKDYLLSRPVYMPDEVVHRIQDASVVVLTSPRFAPVIQKRIECRYSGIPDTKTYVIAEYLSRG